MSMYDAIMGTRKQFAFEPKIENEKRLKKMDKYILIGMGGSHLSGDLLKYLKPEIDAVIYSGYGLPNLPKNELKKGLIILSSYSGNTEETIDAYKKAGELGLARVAISIGGKLLKLAKKDGTPYVKMPDFGIQPRSALALSMKGILKIIGDKKLLAEMTKLKDKFDPEKLEKRGREISQKLRGYYPVIYASDRNAPLAYNWKIKFNETGKIPAFYNVIPELNHNEINGLDTKGQTKKLSEKMCFVFLTDPEDHPKNRKRMLVTKKIYKNRGLKTLEVKISRGNIFEKIFENLTIADFASYFTAEGYGLEAEQVPIVEEFKKLLKD